MWILNRVGGSLGNSRRNAFNKRQRKKWVKGNGRERWYHETIPRALLNPPACASPRRDALTRTGQRTPRRSRFLAGLFITPDGRKRKPARARVRLVLSLKASRVVWRNCYSYAFMPRNNVASRRNDGIGPAVFGEARLCRSVRSVSLLESNLGLLLDNVSGTRSIFLSRVFNIFLMKVKSIYQKIYLSKQKKIFPNILETIYVKLSFIYSYLLQLH